MAYMYDDLPLVGQKSIGVARSRPWAVEGVMTMTMTEKMIDNDDNKDNENNKQYLSLRNAFATPCFTTPPGKVTQS